MPQSTSGAFPGADIWVLEIGKSDREPNLANTVAERWLLFRVWPKIQSQSGWNVTVHYRGEKSLSCLPTNPWLSTHTNGRVKLHTTVKEGVTNLEKKLFTVLVYARGLTKPVRVKFDQMITFNHHGEVDDKASLVLNRQNGLAPCWVVIKKRTCLPVSPLSRLLPHWTRKKRVPRKNTYIHTSKNRSINN